MRILILAAVIASIGVLPVLAFDTMVQPQLDSMQNMYSSMDETANEIATGKDVNSTETYRQAEQLSSGYRPIQNP